MPRIALRYPPYFGECVERVMKWVQGRLPHGTVKHLGSIPTVVPLARRDADVARRRADGCVDPTLRYHELENLYILSTSVFPSASSANPTLTLGALALRLGDHLGRRAEAVTPWVAARSYPAEAVTFRARSLGQPGQHE